MTKQSDRASSDRLAENRLVSPKAVCSMTSVSRGTLYTMARRGDFPRPLQIGTRRVAWREADVLAWLATRESVSWAAVSEHGA